MHHRNVQLSSAAMAALVLSCTMIGVVTRVSALTIEPDGSGLSFPHRTAAFGALAGRYMIVGPIIRAAPDARLCSRPTDLPDEDALNALNEPIRQYYLTKNWGNGTVWSSSSTGGGGGNGNFTGSTGGNGPVATSSGGNGPATSSGGNGPATSSGGNGPATSTGGVNPQPPNNRTGSSTGGFNPNPPNNGTGSTGGNGPATSSGGNGPATSSGGNGPATSSGGNGPATSTGGVNPQPPNNRTGSSTGGNSPSTSSGGNGPATSSGGNGPATSTGGVNPQPPNNRTGSSTGGFNPNPPNNGTGSTGGNGPATSSGGNGPATSSGGNGPATSSGGNGPATSTGGVNPQPPSNRTGSSTGGINPNPPNNRTGSSTGGSGPSTSTGGSGFTGNNGGGSSTGGTPYVPTGANNGSLPSIPITFGFVVYATRGDCTFLAKARWAQAIGASALIIGNTDRDAPILMLGNNGAKNADLGADITIPVVSVGAASFEAFLDAAGDDPINLAYRGDVALPNNGEGDPLEQGGGFRDSGSSSSSSSSSSKGMASWMYFVLGAAAMVLLVAIVGGVVCWRSKRSAAARRTGPAVAENPALAGIDVVEGGAPAAARSLAVPSAPAGTAAVILGEPSPARGTGVPGGLKHWDSQRRPSYSQSAAGTAATGVVVVNPARYGYPVTEPNTTAALTAPHTPLAARYHANTTTAGGSVAIAVVTPGQAPHSSAPLPAYPVPMSTNGTPYPTVPAAPSYLSTIVAPVAGAYHPAHNTHAEGQAVVVLTMGNAVVASSDRDRSPSTSLTRQAL